MFLGVFPAALAYASWAYVLSRIPASKAGSFLYIGGPTTVLIAWVWIDEIPSLLSLVGGLVALSGVVIVNTWGRAAARAALSATPRRGADTDLGRPRPTAAARPRTGRYRCASASTRSRFSPVSAASSAWTSCDPAARRSAPGSR